MKEISCLERVSDGGSEVALVTMSLSGRISAQGRVWRTRR